MSLFQGLKLELIVYGYIRNSENEIILSCNVPNEIKKEIMKWAKCYFSWKNTSPQSKGYTVMTDDEKQIEISGNLGWTKLALKYDLNKKEAEKFEWELTINSVHNISVYCMIGFVESPMDKHINRYNTCFGTGVHEFGVYVYTGCQCVDKYGRDGSSKVIYPSIPIKIKFDDKFRFVLDFTAKTITLYYNDQFAATVYEDIPETLCPAICCYKERKPYTITCTKFGPCT